MTTPNERLRKGDPGGERLAGLDPSTIVIFGDFNCPFSALASARAATIEELGIAEVEWRAVEHSAEIPTEGEAVTGMAAIDLRRELDQVRGLLAPGEADALRLPSRLPNTHEAAAAYAATPPQHRAIIRERLFAGYWNADADLADRAVIDELCGPERDKQLAAKWQEAWQALPNPLVPVMVLPDGYMSRGLGALARLGQATAGNRRRLHGQ